MDNESLLFFSKILHSKTNKKPFEFMVINNIFSKIYYEELSNELYKLDITNFKINHYGNGGKFRNTILIYNSNYLDNYNKLLKNSFFKKTTDFIIENQHNFYKLLKKKFPNHKLHDDYYLFYSIVKDQKKYYIEPHCDGLKTLFTILIYCPINDDNINLGTEIYSKKSGICKNCSKLKHFQKDCLFSIENKINFSRNKIIIFAPNDHSWHGVQDINEIVDTRNSIQLFFKIK